MYLSNLLNKKIVETNIEKSKAPTITSQKANGVFFLEKAAEPLADLNIIPNKHWLFNAGTHFEENDFSWPVFARPCPIVPRHGFVDSIVCKTALELNSVSKKTFEVEPEGEILIATPIKCNISGIICGNSITYGPDNDGATSGKACGHFYISEDVISKKINLDKALIKDGEVPFYEVVFDPEQHQTILVQARSAPGTNGFKDYIPKEITVEKIIKAEGDLLEWEDLLKKVDSSTTIIDHVGGSLASHYAIHALINKVPIFTTYLPEIGQTIQPIVIDETYTQTDKQNFIEAFQNGFNSPKHILSDKSHYELKNYCILALATLHNYSIIKFNKDYNLLGNVLGLFCKTAFAVSIGESRYCSSVKGIAKLPSGRTECYKEMKTLSNNNFLNHLKLAYFSFKKCSYSGGYGGQAWFICTDKIIDIYNYAISGDVDNAIKNFNDVIHLNHNGGFYLNKIIEKSYFDEAANNPSEFTIKYLPTILNILKTIHDFIKLKAPYDSIENIDKQTILNYSTIDKLFQFLSGKEINEKIKDNCPPPVSTTGKQVSWSTISTANDKSNILTESNILDEKYLWFGKDKNNNFYITSDNYFVFEKAIPLTKNIKPFSIDTFNSFLKNASATQKVIKLINSPYYWTSEKCPSDKISKEWLKKHIEQNNIVFVDYFNTEHGVVLKEDKKENIKVASIKVNNNESEYIYKNNDENIKDLYSTIEELFEIWKSHNNNAQL